jgi:hypothetical protein
MLLFLVISAFASADSRIHFDNSVFESELYQLHDAASIRVPLFFIQVSKRGNLLVTKTAH